jgi:hypothetical protein
VIAFHRYWYGIDRGADSLFGWFVALRGAATMAFPSTIETGATDTPNSGLAERDGSVVCLRRVGVGVGNAADRSA